MGAVGVPEPNVVADTGDVAPALVERAEAVAGAGHASDGFDLRPGLGHVDPAVREPGPQGVVGHLDALAHHINRAADEDRICHRRQ